MDNLWPDDITTINVKVPVAILREQASLLGKKTQNIVESQVQRLDKGLEDVGMFVYGFYIVAPALGNYRYKLFTVCHDVSSYPVNFDIDEDIKNEICPDKNTISAESEKEFLEILKKIFQSKRTKQIIGSLISQSVTF